MTECRRCCWRRRDESVTEVDLPDVPIFSGSCYPRSSRSWSVLCLACLLVAYQQPPDGGLAAVERSCNLTLRSSHGGHADGLVSLRLRQSWHTVGVFWSLNACSFEQGYLCNITARASRAMHQKDVLHVVAIAQLLRSWRCVLVVEMMQSCINSCLVSDPEPRFYHLYEKITVKPFFCRHFMIIHAIFNSFWVIRHKKINVWLYQHL